MVSIYETATMFGAFDCQITNSNNNETVKLNGSLAHLIADHSFFEGSVPHRVDPIQLARVLDLTP